MSESLDKTLVERSKPFIPDEVRALVFCARKFDQVVKHTNVDIAQQAKK